MKKYLLIFLFLFKFSFANELDIGNKFGLTMDSFEGSFIENKYTGVSYRNSMFHVWDLDKGRIICQNYLRAKFREGSILTFLPLEYEFFSVKDFSVIVFEEWEGGHHLILNIINPNTCKYIFFRSNIKNFGVGWIKQNSKSNLELILIYKDKNNIFNFAKIKNNKVIVFRKFKNKNYQNYKIVGLYKNFLVLKKEIDKTKTIKEIVIIDINSKKVNRKIQDNISGVNLRKNKLIFNIKSKVTIYDFDKNSDMILCYEPPAKNYNTFLIFKDFLVFS